MNKYIAIILLVFSGTVFADISGKVVAVTDGDTIKILDSNNVQYKVRLTGIDAPEKTQPFGNALATCGYRSDGKYDCGTRTKCGYTGAGGKYDCGTRTNCGYKSAEGKYHCEGDG